MIELKGRVEEIEKKVIFGNRRIRGDEKMREDKRGRTLQIISIYLIVWGLWTYVSPGAAAYIDGTLVDESWNEFSTGFCNRRLIHKSSVGDIDVLMVYSANQNNSPPYNAKVIRTTDSGDNWELLPDPGIVLQGNNKGICMAGDSEDKIHVVWHAWETGDSGHFYHKEYSAGAWTLATRLSENAEKGGRTIVTATDSQDDLHVAWQNESFGKTYYRRRTGGSWQPIVILGALGPQTAIAVDYNDDIHIVGGYSTNNTLRYRKCTGGLWGDIETIDEEGAPRHASLAVDSNNEPHIAWTGDGYELTWKIFYSVRREGEWTGRQLLSHPAVDCQESSIGIDGNDDVYVIYNRIPDSKSENTELCLKKKIGDEWTHQVRLTDSEYGSFGAQVRWSAFPESNRISDAEDLDFVWTQRTATGPVNPFPVMFYHGDLVIPTITPTVEQSPTAAPTTTPAASPSPQTPTETPPSSTPTPDPSPTQINQGPFIMAAGYMGTYLDGSGGGTLTVTAYIKDPENDAVERCAVYYGGQPAGLEEEFAHNEGEIIWNYGPVELSGGLNPGEFLLELIAWDEKGEMSGVWPYFNSGLPEIHTSVPPWYAGEFSGPKSGNQPVVNLAGYWDSSCDENGGELTLIALASDPQGLDDIERVKLFYEGNELDVELLDDGQSGDLAAGDGVYGFQASIPPDALPDGHYLLEIAAFDRNGESSDLWPYIVIHRPQTPPPDQTPTNTPPVQITSTPTPDATGLPSLSDCIAAAPLSHDFGLIWVGEAGPVETITTISNNCGYAVRLSISVDGEPHFELVDPAECLDECLLEPGADPMTVRMRFTPQECGAISGTLYLNFKAQGQDNYVITLQLTGIGRCV